MSITDQLNADLKNAMKSGDKFRRETLRNLKSAIKYAEIDAGESLDNEGILAVIAKQAKQRRDSIAEFKKAGRTDLVEKEEGELAILQSYLPAQLSEDEIRQQVAQVIEQVGATGMKDMGQVMKQSMALLKGKADGKLVNQVVRQLLGNQG
ncbi:MAG: GatB/YqeY domain-containing protein [Chloroflexi bacterium]|nr:MAG: GatB/YqeY domain-containing protein [Chloroflexota bacterium]